ncbi:MAG: response regulator [Firmicutes bacterium]|nr:response regulator [Bacillota bacterium]
MPRLLLVDDNPSIHKIAESLLARTDVELVCVDGAKAALQLVSDGQAFDLALIDAMMPVTNGWDLLQQLRAHPATARMPIAMMAGVLDTVEPALMEHPDIQGFLRKPVELRDLGSRVHALLEAPVAAPAPKAEEAAPVEPEKAADTALADVLVLEEGDLWAAEPQAAPEIPIAGTRTEDLSLLSELPPEEPLDIEEFDFEGLRHLTPGTVGTAAFREPAEEIRATTPSPTKTLLEPTPEVPPSPLPEMPPPPPEPALVEELSPFAPEALAQMGASPEDNATPSTPLPDFTALEAPDSTFLPDLGEVSSASDAVVQDWSHTHPVPLMEAVPVAAQAVVPVGEPVAHEAVSVEALLQALLTKPELMDRLSQAVVAKLGDQTLREIAWEVMPELAERHARP